MFSRLLISPQCICRRAQTQSLLGSLQRSRKPRSWWEGARCPSARNLTSASNFGRSPPGIPPKKRHGFHDQSKLLQRVPLHWKGWKHWCSGSFLLKLSPFSLQFCSCSLLSMSVLFDCTVYRAIQPTWLTSKFHECLDAIGWLTGMVFPAQCVPPCAPQCFVIISIKRSTAKVCTS